MRASRILGVLLILAAARLPAQQTSPAAMDSLLDRLVGRWSMSGTVRKEPANYALDVTRVLQARFIELHMTEVSNPPQYEARVFIGVDSARSEYIAHWMDSFGAPYSIPPATGTMRGDTITLFFPYPDGTFRDTFSYDRRANTWHFLIEAADSAGGWSVFGDHQVRRR